MRSGTTAVVADNRQRFSEDVAVALAAGVSGAEVPRRADQGYATCSPPPIHKTLVTIACDRSYALFPSGSSRRRRS